MSYLRLDCLLCFFHDSGRARSRELGLESRLSDWLSNVVLLYHLAGLLEVLELEKFWMTGHHNA